MGKAAGRKGRQPPSFGRASYVNLGASEISDKLIAYVSDNEPVREPPRKRQKLIPEIELGEPEDVKHAYIIVKEGVLEIHCSGSKMKGLPLPLERNNISISAPKDARNRDFFEILDNRKIPIHRDAFPTDEDDFTMAVDVAQQRTKWVSGQGRAWTEFGVRLLNRHDEDIIQVSFTIKWSVTDSPYNVPQVSKKPRSIISLLSCFPGSQGNSADAWSPQDFYQSVHTPNKNDDSALSLQTTGIESTLFPFQKRAVQWLLRREGVEWSSLNFRVQDTPQNAETGLPVSFVKTTDARGTPCFVSHLFGIVTLDVVPFEFSNLGLHGGILAEEMGLGKTLEIISLVALHKRPPQPPTIYDLYLGEHVRPTSATLIISPPSILKQWISEVNTHAPHLKVMHYEGIRSHDNLSPTELVEQLASSDIVVSTYSILAAEIHFTRLNPEKSLRNEAKYPRPKSPLMQLSWWRVCIDEAQMIESGVSNAAVVARMIPRINAWVITGTPVRKDVNDLLGLLIFLRCEPYPSKQVWTSLITAHKHDFRNLFGQLALRHSKRDVREELKLPAQRRYVITMPFTPIEEQHYQELFNQMCSESGVNEEGSPLTDGWDPSSVSEIMRAWLVRLRQTALHPEIGGKNRRALGNKEGPLRTVKQVLETMIENTDQSIRTDQRTMHVSKLRRGQLYENSPLVKQALEIWNGVIVETAAIVEECREILRQELEAQSNSTSAMGSRSASDVESLDEPEDLDPTSRLGIFRNRLRGALEVHHMAIFFRANAYFQIKSNEDMTAPDSPEFQSLEKLEIEAYEEAKALRREILQEAYLKADRLMQKISDGSGTDAFVQIPEFSTNPQNGGLESQRLLRRLDELATILDAQANHLDEWREQTIQFLLRPLVDEDDGVEITGDEYEESTKTQDEVMVYIHALRTVIADRHYLITHQENKLVAHEMKVAIKLAKDGEGLFPEKTIELFAIREQLKPTEQMGSMRGIVADLRYLATDLKQDAERGNNRSRVELAIVEEQLKDTQKQLSEQTKATAALEKEVELFNSVINTRLEYYRQLQQVSDTVAPYEGDNDAKVIQKMLDEEDKLEKRIATAKSKKRYLEHLRTEAENPQDQRICVICRENFEVGALTVCGHQYCKECIRHWWQAHHNCPVCKRRLTLADMQEITYKPQELTIHAEEVNEPNQERTSPSKSRKSAIYSEFSNTKLAEIKSVELDGPSFTTKIDTLARHLIWLRESDPGAKSIIYSQFKDFLEVLARAFTKFRIGYSSIDKLNGIEIFKRDPGVECFLLHARAHSSGLNLVNASHVFLCEPLLNTALELQAIARVDRIGQHQETNVWLYLVDGTVEESIHQLSVQRRMEHIGLTFSNRKGKSKASTPEEILDTNLEEANSMELQQGSLTNLLAKGGKGGENIKEEDLWECLFGGVGQRNNKRKREDELRLDPEMIRHLGATAAEERMEGVEGT